MAPISYSREHFFQIGLRRLPTAHQNPHATVLSNCTVCLEALRSRPEEIVRIRACGHVFHMGCLKGWLQPCRTGQNSCPNCRLELFPSLRWSDLTVMEEILYLIDTLGEHVEELFCLSPSLETSILRPTQATPQRVSTWHRIRRHVHGRRRTEAAAESGRYGIYPRLWELNTMSPLELVMTYRYLTRELARDLAEYREWERSMLSGTTLAGGAEVDEVEMHEQNRSDEDGHGLGNGFVRAPTRRSMRGA